MTKSIGTLIVSLAALGVGSGAERVERPLPLMVREIPTDTLRDIAVARYDVHQSVIYYNPILMQKVGPHLAAFFMAHEYGHIYYHHTRANALIAGREGRDSLLQLRELEADCYAATTLGRTNRLAVESAARFFSRMGPYRFDAEHPSGGQRAAKILGCLPPRDTVLETAADLEGGREGVVTIRVKPSPLGPGAYGRNVRVWIDGRFAGTLTTMGQRSDLQLRELEPGIHEYAVELDLFLLDEEMQFTASGTVAGRGILDIRGGETFNVDWSAGHTPSLQGR
jgi:hypothetical protein